MMIIKEFIIGVLLTLRLFNTNIDVESEEMLKNTELMENLMNYDEKISEKEVSLKDEGYEFEHEIIVHENYVEVNMKAESKEAYDNVDVMKEFMYVDSSITNINMPVMITATFEQ